MSVKVFSSGHVPHFYNKLLHRCKGNEKVTLSELPKLYQVLNYRLQLWMLVPGYFNNLDQKHDDHLEDLLIA